MKVLFVASECVPFVKTGGLADVSEALPKELCKNGLDVRVIIPKYSQIAQEYKDEMRYITNFYIKMGWRSQYCGIFELLKDGVIYYFVDNEFYFSGEAIYSDIAIDVERFAFFDKAVLAMLQTVDFWPDVIHCNDWQSAMIPVLLKAHYNEDERYCRIKTVLTIHNIIYQGRVGKHILGDVLGFDAKHTSLLTYDNDVNFLKASMICSDRVVTVSDSYSKEIQTPEGGVGLDAIARSISHKLYGIVNGLDYNFYHPSIDKVIWCNYDCDNLDKKAKNKEELQKYFGLEVNPKAPILSVVSRMVKNKGFDIVKATMENILNSTNAQFVGVGEGDREYEDYFKYLNAKYPGRVHVSLGFSVDIGKKIYGGSDIFLMPSISEPCGISQMIASKYGAVPIVREVGGLKDTIKDFGCPEGGNGYTFHDYNSNDFEYSIRRAINDYKDEKEWTNKVKTAMNMDFSWNRSMDKYVELYKEI